MYSTTVLLYCTVLHRCSPYRDVVHTSSPMAVIHVEGGELDGDGVAGLGEDREGAVHVIPVVVWVARGAHQAAEAIVQHLGEAGDVVLRLVGLGMSS